MKETMNTRSTRASTVVRPDMDEMFSNSCKNDSSLMKHPPSASEIYDDKDESGNSSEEDYHKIGSIGTSIDNTESTNQLNRSKTVK